MTGRGESLNGSSGSCSTITIPGASGATVSSGGKGENIETSNQSLYSNIVTGTEARYFRDIGQRDYREGKSVISTCACYGHGSTGGGAGGLSTGSNVPGGDSDTPKYLSLIHI